MLMLRQPQRRRQRQRVVQSTSLPAPVGGWNTKAPLASMDPLSAVELRNWFPQPGYVEVRKGYRQHGWDLGSAVKTVSSINTGTDTLTSNAHGMSNGDVVKFHATTTLPGGLAAADSYYVVNSATNTFQVSQTAGGSAVDITSSGSGTIYVYELIGPTVETLAVWQGPASSKLIAAAGGALWDVTARSAGSLSHAAGAADDAWQWCSHVNSGASYLYMVNGADAALHYNGSAWTAPTISGATDGTDAVHVVSHKKRLWFTLKDTTKAAYLDTDAIAGTATAFEFGALFSRGGYLNALATWTRDGGAGSDDYLVAISSRGQVAIYQGTDPASASTWELVGVFDVPPPIGRRCFHRYGADLLLVTLEGVFPLSNLLSVDQTQVSRVAITDNIAPTFNSSARSYGSNWGWELCTYPKGTRLIVNIPTSEGATAKQYVMNTLTGAWCEFDNHNATCWVAYNDDIYFGGPGGKLYQADTGSADVDEPIKATGQAAYSAFGSANLKRFSMIRPLVSVDGSNRPSVGISTDFVETQSLSALSAATSTSGSLWDSAVWDSASWSSVDQEINDWANVVGLGTFGSVKFTARTGVSVGGGAWGVGLWGSLLWGSKGRSDETMRIQGFVLLFEPGEYV